MRDLGHVWQGKLSERGRKDAGRKEKKKKKEKVYEMEDCYQMVSQRKGRIDR